MFFHRITNLYTLLEMYHFKLRGFMLDVNHCCNCGSDKVGLKNLRWIMYDRIMPCEFLGFCGWISLFHSYSFMCDFTLC